MIKIKNNIILLLFPLNYFIVLTFDNSLININSLHRLIFSFVNFFLLVMIILWIYSNKEVFPDNKFIIVSLLFLSGLFISSYMNDRILVFYESFFLCINLFIFAVIISLMLQITDKNKLFNFLSNSIIISGFVFSVIGILDFYGSDILSMLPGYNSHTKFMVHNFASEFLIGVLPYTLFVLILKKKLYQRIIIALVSVVILSYLFLLRTRTTYIALIVMLLVTLYYFIKYKRNKSTELNISKAYKYILAILVISFLIGLLPNNHKNPERQNLIYNIGTIFESGNASNSARLDYINYSFKMFLKQPLFGIGTGNWFAVYPEYIRDMYNDENIMNNADLNPHNDYVKILSENGIIGFILFIAIILFSVYKLIIYSNKNILYFPILLSLIGIAVFSFFAFPSENVSAMILFFTAIGIGIGKNNPQVNKKRVFVFGILFSIIIFLVISVIYHYKRYESEKIYLSSMFDKAKGNYQVMNNKLESINEVYYPLDANKTPIEFYKGAGFFEQKDFKKALESYKKCLEITPYSPTLLNNLALTYYMEGDADKADSLFSIVLNNYPYYIEPKINLLTIYANLKKDTSARNLISEIEKLKLNTEKINNYTTFLKIKSYYNEKFH
jgi:O-antigen ligase